MKTKKVIDLIIGDELSSGVKIFQAPVRLVNTPKNKLEIGVEYPNGKRKFQLWNRSTEVTIKP